jgi:hypothetical protein
VQYHRFAGGQGSQIGQMLVQFFIAEVAQYFGLLYSKIEVTYGFILTKIGWATFCAIFHKHNVL